MAVIDTTKVFKEARAIAEKMQRITAELEANKSGRPHEELQRKQIRAIGEAHREIENAIQIICRERDIGIVLRVVNDSVNSNDLSSTLQHVNRQIVYSAVPDLTADVIAALNKTSR